MPVAGWADCADAAFGAGKVLFAAGAEPGRGAFAVLLAGTAGEPLVVARALGAMGPSDLTAPVVPTALAGAALAGVVGEEGAEEADCGERVPAGRRGGGGAASQKAMVSPAHSQTQQIAHLSQARCLRV